MCLCAGGGGGGGANCAEPTEMKQCWSGNTRVSNDRSLPLHAHLSHPHMLIDKKKKKKKKKNESYEKKKHTHTHTKNTPLTLRCSQLFTFTFCFAIWGLLESTWSAKSGPALQCECACVSCSLAVCVNGIHCINSTSFVVQNVMHAHNYKHTHPSDLKARCAFL